MAKRHPRRRNALAADNTTPASGKALAADNSDESAASAVPLTTAYEDHPGFCKSSTLQDIQANDYVLTPGRYVGAAPLEDDGIPFETKMTDLTATLYEQMDEAEKLDQAIRKNLEVLGYGE